MVLFLILCCKICYCQDWDRQTTTRFFAIINLNKLRMFLLNLLQKFKQIRVWIWNRISKIYFLILKIKLISKTQTLLDDLIFSPFKISKSFILVLNLSSILCPLHLGFLENIRFHSIFIQQTTFCKVYDVEFYFFLFFYIKNFEKIPAGVSFCITVNSHDQVIFIRTWCNGKIKIATLKLWTKFDILTFGGRIYSFK